MLTCVPLKYIMDSPMLNAFISVGKSIRRVNDKTVILLFFNQTCVLGTQKNHLIEMVRLSTQNTCYNKWIRKNAKFYPQYICLS